MNSARLSDFALILTENSGGRAYAQVLLRKGWLPRALLFLDIPTKATSRNPLIRLYWRMPEPVQLLPYRPYLASLAGKIDFDPLEPVTVTLRKHSVKYDVLRVESFNDAPVLDWVRQVSTPYVIYTGGGIVRSPAFGLGKKFIHVHPGYLPFVRGSDGVLWSILVHGECGASCFFMDETIDTGNIIRRRFFPIPLFRSRKMFALFPRFHLMMLRRLLERSYDVQYRVEVLCEVLEDYLSKGSLPSSPQDRSEGETYHIMHPFLANLALARCLNP